MIKVLFEDTLTSERMHQGKPADSSSLVQQ
jgi:hypothetical protein